MKVVLLVLITACGRIGFDAGGGGMTIDGPPPGDGARDGTVDGTPIIDAFAPVCANAIDVAVGSTAALDTCNGLDNIDTCSTAKRELVFRFVPPTTRGYTIKARDAGTQNVSNSTSRMDMACGARMGGCTGVLGTSLTAGVPVYFVVEASTGACASIQFDIQ